MKPKGALFLSCMVWFLIGCFLLWLTYQYVTIIENLVK